VVDLNTELVLPFVAVLHILPPGSKFDKERKNGSYELARTAVTKLDVRLANERAAVAEALPSPL
jgi:hypothetical protein